MAEITFSIWQDSILQNKAEHNRLKVARAEAGLTSNQVAAKVSISPTTVFRFERGIPPKKNSTRAALAAAVGRDESELF
ncbi:MAG TPA: helix-turn-helix transcriptional regulator [Solirubrobacteraceae bacterium]|jgi:DNA-binding XRE family transcriptional regulator|nr:helix-turn-helix transcriptional regulator [Solirubrobacteraceae bacterium]